MSGTTISQTPVFVPTQISGCQLWLDAADSTAVQLTSGLVSQWTDKSGSNTNATQATAGNRPSYGTVNGKVSVVFSGSPTFMILPSITSIPISIFVVAAFTQNINNTFLLALGNTNGSAIYVREQFSPDVFGIDNGITAYNSAIKDLNTRIWSFTLPASANGVFLLDGTTIATSGFTFAANTTFATNSLGTWNQQSNNGNVRAGISEVLIYNTALSTSQRQQVEGYLAWKWGLQGNLPSNHPYKLSPFLGVSIAPVPVSPALAISNPVFLPTYISGCQLWLDAADLVTLTLSGTSVTEWRDKSGNSRNAVVSSNAFAMYSNTGLFFSNSYYTTSYTGSPTNESFFSVFTTAGVLNTASNGIVGTQTGGRTILVGHGGNSNIAGGSNVFGMNASGVYPGAAVSGLVGNTRFIGLTQVSGGTTTFASLNGSNLSLPITFAGLTGGTTTTFGRETTTTQAFNGFSHEFVVYNSVLSTAQRQQVEGYLAWKWGLQANLPSNHPYKLSPFLGVSIAPNPVQPPQIKSASWLPTQVSGCQLWLDAADSTTIKFSSGSNVNTWTDKVNNRVFTTQGTAANLTLIKGINGLNSIYFNNTASDSVYMSGTFQSVITGSAFFVFQAKTQRTVDWRPFFTWWSTGTYPAYGYLGNTTTNTVGPYTTYAGNGTPTQVLTNNVNYMIFYGWSGTTTSITTNGSAVQTGSQPSYSSSTTTCWIGGDGVDAYARVTLFYGEILIYNSVLNQSQRQQVEGYLAWKWGLQSNLPSGHPYKMFPPSP